MPSLFVTASVNENGLVSWPAAMPQHAEPRQDQRRGRPLLRLQSPRGMARITFSIRSAVYSSSRGVPGSGGGLRGCRRAGCPQARRSWRACRARAFPARAQAPARAPPSAWPRPECRLRSAHRCRRGLPLGSDHESFFLPGASLSVRMSSAKRGRTTMGNIPRGMVSDLVAACLAAGSLLPAAGGGQHSRVTRLRRGFSGLLRPGRTGEAPEIAAEVARQQLPCRARGALRCSFPPWQMQSNPPTTGLFQ